MINRILLVTLFLSPCLYADWIDDLSQHAKGKNLNVNAAIKSMEAYIQQEEKEICKLEKDISTPHKKGIVASARDARNKMKDVTATKCKHNHDKVLEFLRSLPRNERDREKFSEQLSAIRTANEELKKLRDESSKTATLTEATKNTAEIAAKEVYVNGLKAALKTSFMQS